MRSIDDPSSKPINRVQAPMHPVMGQGPVQQKQKQMQGVSEQLQTIKRQQMVAPMVPGGDTGVQAQAMQQSDITLSQQRRQNIRQQLTALAKNRNQPKPYNEPIIRSLNLQQDVLRAQRNGQISRESSENVTARRISSLLRPGFAPDEKMNRSSRANSPTTPNFIMRINNQMGKEDERSMQISKQIMDRYCGISNEQQFVAEPSRVSIGPNSQLPYSKQSTTAMEYPEPQLQWQQIKRVEGTSTSGQQIQHDALTSQINNFHLQSDTQSNMAFHQGNAMAPQIQMQNQIKMRHSIGFDQSSQRILNENKQVLDTNSSVQAPKPKSTSKYQKLPHRKGKYNEPYHDGLYRFQDIKLVIPEKSGAGQTSEAGNTQESAKLPKMENLQKSQCDNMASPQNQNIIDRQQHTSERSDKYFERSMVAEQQEGIHQHQMHQISQGMKADTSIQQNGVLKTTLEKNNIQDGVRSCESSQIKQNQEENKQLSHHGRNDVSHQQQQHEEQDSDTESEAAYYLLGHQGVKTFISPEQFKIMKKLNPSLQYADENGGALKPSEMQGGPQPTSPDDQKHQQDSLKRQMVNGKDGDRKLQTEVKPEQLKPEVFQNNDGSGSQMGRWTREEHMKFIKALQLFGKDWQCVQKYVMTRSSTQIRSHAQKFFGQIKRKGGQILIRDNKYQSSKAKKLLQNSGNQNNNTDAMQSCAVVQSTIQDESQYSQIGAMYNSGEQRQMPNKIQSGNSQDGTRGLGDGRLETQGDCQSGILFAVQKFQSRQEIDQAKQEILFDEQMNRKVAQNNLLQKDIQSPGVVAADLDQSETDRRDGDQHLQYENNPLGIHQYYSQGHQNDSIPQVQYNGTARLQTEMEPMEDQLLALDLRKLDKQRNAQQEVYKRENLKTEPQETFRSSQNKIETNGHYQTTRREKRLMDAVSQQSSSYNNQQKVCQVPQVQQQSSGRGVAVNFDRQQYQQQQQLQQQQYQQLQQQQIQHQQLQNPHSPVDQERSQQEQQSIQIQNQYQQISNQLQAQINLQRINQQQMSTEAQANVSLRSKKITKIKKQLGLFPGQSRNKVDPYLFEQGYSSEQKKGCSSDYKKRLMIQEKKIQMHKSGQKESGSKSKSFHLNHQPTLLAATQTIPKQSLRKTFTAQTPKARYDERFANQLILKYNILNFKKRNFLDDVKRLEDIGPRYHSYLEHIESQVTMMQQYLPKNFGTSTESVRHFIENSSQSLQMFLETFDQFLMIEMEKLQNRVSNQDILKNLVLFHDVKLNIKRLNGVTTAISQLSDTVNALNDKIQQFTSNKQKVGEGIGSGIGNRVDIQVVRPTPITQFDMLKNECSGITHSTSLLQLQLVLSDEFINRAVAQMNSFIASLHHKLIEMNPDIDQMDLESEENIQVMVQLSMQHRQGQIINSARQDQRYTDQPRYELQQNQQQHPHQQSHPHFYRASNSMHY